MSRQNVKHAGSEVLTVVVKKGSIFRDITPGCLLKVNRRFEGARRHHLEGRRRSQAS
jgi:hypothetical protein